jgi:AraC-like DNA-binding protein
MSGHQLDAWRPPVPGVAEILHARFLDHAYPPHVHEVWTLLVVDAGAIRYGLDGRVHSADPAAVTLLPPYVVHDGRPATADGFRKRVIYLEPDVIGADLVGAAADHPTILDPLLRGRIHQLDLALSEPGETLQAESRLAFVAERLRLHLRNESELLSDRPRASRDRQPAESAIRLSRGLARRATASRGSGRLAADLRDMMDARIQAGLSLQEAAARLDTSPTHLVRSFTAAYGLPPHAYLTGRRIEKARHLLVAGLPPAEAAAAAGFYDQAHLNRHFRRYLGTTPARFVRLPPSAA